MQIKGDEIIDIDLDKLGDLPNSPAPVPNNDKGNPGVTETPATDTTALPAADNILDDILKTDAEVNQESPTTDVESNLPADDTSKPEDKTTEEGETEATDEEVNKILQEIMSSEKDVEDKTAAVEETTKDVKDIVEKSGDDELKKKYSELESQLQEKDLASQKLQVSYSTLQKEYDKLLTDKLTADVQNTQIAKVNEAIESDPDLRAVVVYAIKSKTDDTYKTKLSNSVQEYLRKVAGVDVDELKKQIGTNAKSALGTDTTTISDMGWGSEPLYGMFE